MKKLLLLLIALVCLAGLAPAQGTVSHVRYGSSLPATCSATDGEIFFLTSGTVGLYSCTATNTWTLSGNNSSYGGAVVYTSSHTVGSSDLRKMIVMNCATSCTLTFESAPTSTDSWGVISIGSTVATISLNGKTYNGSASVPVLNSYRIMNVASDGSNYLGEAPLVAGANMTLTPGTNGMTLAASPGSSAYGGANIYTSSHTIGSGDMGKLVVMNCSTSCTVTFEASPSSSDYFGVMSIGSSVATISLNSHNYNGSASVPVLNKFRDMRVASDGTNYFGDAPLSAGTNVTFTPASNGMTVNASSPSAYSTLTFQLTAASTSSVTSLAPITIPTGMSFAACTGSLCIGTSQASATASTTVTLYKNGVSFCTATYAIGGSTPTFSCSATSFAQGDVLKIVYSGDTTLIPSVSFSVTK